MAKQNKSKKKQSTPLYSVYGARVSNSGKYINLSLVSGEEDEKQWATACVKRGGKYIKTKTNADTITLVIPRLDIEDDDEDEDEEVGPIGGAYDSDIANTPLTDEGLTPVASEDKEPF